MNAWPKFFFFPYAWALLGAACLGFAETLKPVAEMSLDEIIDEVYRQEESFEQASIAIALAETRLATYKDYRDTLERNRPDPRVLKYEQLIYDLDRMIALAEEEVAIHRDTMKLAQERLSALEENWTPYDVVAITDFEDFDPLPEPPEEDFRTTEQKLDEALNDTFGKLRDRAKARLNKFELFLQDDSAQTIAIETMRKNEAKLMKELDSAYQLYLSKTRAMGKTTTREPPPGFYDRNPQ